MKGFHVNDKKYIKYAIDVIQKLKALAIKAKLEADNSKIGFANYTKGALMGYYSIITLLKNQAFAFCIDQNELCLSDIQPDIDLLGLHRNPGADFGENNWAIDVMNNEKIKGYLTDSIMLLKNQSQEAKQDPDDANSADEKYNLGHLMAYHSLFSLLKDEACLLSIEEDQIGLADINPEKDFKKKSAN